MKKSVLVLISVLLSSVAFSQVCSPQEQSAIASQAERNTLEKVRQDIRAEGRVQARALGYDDRDCMDKAHRHVQSLQGRAIEQCVSQTVYFRSCEVSDIRTVQHPTRLQPVAGSGHVDNYEINEQQCRQNAQNLAIQDALQRCQQTYNSACRIVSGPSQATHTVERRRRYGLLGPKENFNICQSSASAMPDAREQVQCVVELVAKVRIL